MLLRLLLPLKIQWAGGCSTDGLSWILYMRWLWPWHRFSLNLMLFQHGATLQNAALPAETMPFRFDFRQVTNYQEVWAFTMCWVSVERRNNSDPSSISNTTVSFMLSIGIPCYCCLEKPQLWFQRSSILRFFNFRWIGWQKCYLCWCSHQPIASLLALIGGLPG